MSKTKLILGNITFHHFSEEELKLFKTDKPRKAIVHSIDSVIDCENSDEACELGEEKLNECESYLVPELFSNGEIVFECDIPNELK